MNKRKALIILVLAAMVIYCAFPFVSSFLHKDDWKEDTTPLPRETITVLCEEFSLSNKDPLCNGTRDIYARDFSNVLREYFRPEDEFGTPKTEAATYDDVENTIGEFMWECQPVIKETNPDLSYFRCFYDLRGDRYWNYAFYFYYPEKTLFSIRAGGGGD